MVKSRGSDEPVERFRFVGELEINQDPAFEEREWRRERWGWLGMAVFLLLAAAGLFGGGVLSDAEASAGGLRVEYQRFIRLQTPTDARLSIAAARGGRQPVRIEWSAGHPIEVRSILPDPARVEGLDNGVVYYFDTAQDAARADVQIEYSISEVGPGRMDIEASGSRVSFGQFVYP